MKKKRLDRDGWGFDYFPYYQLRVDTEDFHGEVCLIRITNGEVQNWHMPNAGFVAVAGEGMTWMQLIPDNRQHLMTVMYLPEDTEIMRENYPLPTEQYKPSIWYVDITEQVEQAEDGVYVYTDKYLDVIFSPEGDIKLDDEDELEQALQEGDVTKEQYLAAKEEAKRVQLEYCSDIMATFRWSNRIREAVEVQISAGAKPMFLYHGSQYKLDLIEPMQAKGTCDAESQLAIYAAETGMDVIPFALPIRAYPDNETGVKSFECEDGKVTLRMGTINPKASGYVYKLSAETFERMDDWQWVSYETVKPLAVREFQARDMMHLVQFKEAAYKAQRQLYG